jgi:hypothetical protein
MFRLFSTIPVEIQLEVPEESKKIEIEQKNVEISKEEEQLFHSRINDLVVSLDLIQKEGLAYYPKWSKRVLLLNKDGENLKLEKSYPLKKTTILKPRRRKRNRK